ncbi:transposase [Candidatus Sumerlaeota bacterium]|nr:transposase [Candidatus Sumerlaeota bacterium]
MARPKRIDISNSLFHVFSHTQSDEKAFPARREKVKFLEYLAEYCDLYEFRIHAWCLMPNHFHLLLESGNRPALSSLMHRLLTAYTVYFNKKRQRNGHLFQGRFKSLVVDKADYLLALSRYIHLNPLNANITKTPENFDGSSLIYYVKGGEPEYLYTKEILAWFDGNRKKYAQFIMEGLNEDTKPPIIQRRFIGAEPFVRRMNARLKQMTMPGTRADKASRKRRIRFSEEEAKKASIIENITGEYFGLPVDMIRNAVYSRGLAGSARSILIYLLRCCLPWTLKDIAIYLGINEKRGVGYHLEKVLNNKSLIMTCEKIKKELLKVC